MREHVVRVERAMEGAAARVWALVADTNRWDRALGLAPARYAWRDAPGGRERVAHGAVFGVPVAWVEPPYQWVEGVFVEGGRRFLSGPIARASMRVDVRPEGPSRARVTARITVAGAAPAVAAFGLLGAPAMRRGAERFLDGVARALAASAGAPAGDAGGEIERAQDAALAVDDPAFRGDASPVDEAELARRAEALAGDARVADAVRAKLLAWVRRAPDDDVESMRPLALARRWGVARDEAVRAFLVATRAGVVDLRWRLICPVCRTGADTARSLTEVGRTVHCDACDRDYGVDFSDHVEAVFAPSPAVRAVEPRVWCASSAWRRPHVVASVSLAPGATLRVAAPPLAGPLLARVAGAADTAPVPSGDPFPTRLTVAAGDDPWPTVTDETSPLERTNELVFVNRRGRPVQLLVERAGPPRDALTGSAMLLFPDYLDLFATDAPARGVELAVGAMAVLFTDLTGSTALYERVGDARAFALVEEHFRDMARVAAARGGTVIKTMGDAVMAAFPRLGDAVRAAVEMSRATAAAHGAQGVSLKLGAHLGPCLAVRANDRLDLFGTTVNVAARLQARAEAHELVLVESALRHADVAAAVAGMPRRTFTASLKGIREVQHLVAIDVRAAG